MQTNPKFRAGILTAATLILATPAFAAAQGSFDAADANHDGRVTLQEFDAYATARLQAGTGRIAQRFRDLSPDQQKARLKQRFDKMDHGAKGYLTPQDWNG